MYYPNDFEQENKKFEQNASHWQNNDEKLEESILVGETRYAMYCNHHTVWICNKATKSLMSKWIVQTKNDLKFVSLKTDFILFE